MTEFAIETHGVGKRFGDRAALQSIDLQVPRGGTPVRVQNAASCPAASPMFHSTGCRR